MRRTLVLGAGASLAYGYPLGSTLRQQILALSHSQAVICGIEPREFERFKQAFHFSQMYSIDAFLARRPQFAEIGKLCIAYVLLGCESTKALFKEAPDKDHWYQYLFNQIAAQDWDDLELDKLSIITFNYDRSLEHFLFISMQHAFGMSSEKVLDKLQAISIVHVYGSLGTILPSGDNYFEYGAGVTSEKVQAAAKDLVVIPEGRTDSQTLVDARKTLEESDAICFLGFGFDSINVDRLAKDEACKRWKARPTGNTARNIIGTCKGMTEAEIDTAYTKLLAESSGPNGGGRFINTGCTDLLRRTMFLR